MKRDYIKNRIYMTRNSGWSIPTKEGILNPLTCHLINPLEQARCEFEAIQYAINEACAEASTDATRRANRRACRIVKRIVGTGHWFERTTNEIMGRKSK